MQSPPMSALSHLPLFLLLLLVMSSPSAHAQVRLFPDEVQRVDVIAIERDGRDVYAFDSLTGNRSSFRLELDEEVLFELSRGRVGVVLTDRRALAVAPGVNWRELRYQLRERAPDVALVDDQLAILITDRRALGFVASGNWVQEDLHAHEPVVALRVASAAGVIATSQRALGLSSDRRGFVSIDLQIKEKLEEVAADGTLATVRTNRRILVFSAPRGRWSTQDRKIN